MVEEDEAPAPSDVGGSTTGCSGGGGSGGGGPASAEKLRGAIAGAGAEAKGTGKRRTAAARERRRRAAREEAIVLGQGGSDFGGVTDGSNLREEERDGRTVVIVLVADAEAPIEERQPAAWGITWRSLASHGSCVRLEQHVDHYEREVDVDDVCGKITSRAGSSRAVRARACTELYR